MATTKKTQSKTAKLIRELKKKNAVLRAKLRKAEEDSEAYRKAAQAYAIKLITPEQRRQWDQEEEDSGRTILDVIKEVREREGAKRRA